MTNPKKIQLENVPKNCQNIKLSWSHYENNAWVPGKQNIFSVSSKTKKGILGLPTNEGKDWFLQVCSKLLFNYLIDSTQGAQFGLFVFVVWVHLNQTLVWFSFKQAMFFE